MWSNQENRVRKQVKNPCEARKIKASQIFHKIISTHLLTWLTTYVISIIEQKEREVTR
jgi:TorA maturation chaperone TorD